MQVSQTQDSQTADIGALLANADTMEFLFQSILGRAIGNDQYKAERENSRSIQQWMKELLNSEEFKNRFAQTHGFRRHGKDFIPDSAYRTPSLTDPTKPASVLVTGSCMTVSWKRVINEAYPSVEIKHQLFNNASELEDIAKSDLQRVDFQIVQLPIRSIIPEADYFSLSLSDEGRSSIESLFKSSVVQLRRNLNAALKYNHAVGIPTFVLNFPVPQANPLGKLLPKYDLFNFSYYVSELNRVLYEMLGQEKSVYMIDYDEITAILGKRFVQDDLTSHINHGSFIGGTHNQYDIHLTPLGSVEELYDARSKDPILAIFNECIATYNIISSNNNVKIVIFDLDGTLWRGVPADRDELGDYLIEGWPLSILEAASFLRKRGILLALASKNDPDLIRRIWTNLYEKRFPISNFVCTKISWNSKVDSVAEILNETNLLPGNCLFVDDNPIEREQVKLAFPEIKVINGPIYTWRRTLLWATELQVPYVTKESASRTESTQTMIKRQAIKVDVNEEQYLRDLNISVRINEVNHLSHPKFTRAFELLNKTNQFNTTGKRWDEREMSEYFQQHGHLLAADVSDRLTDYGLTAVLLHRAGECTQVVMSCRVFGLRVEFAIFDEYLRFSVSERRLLFRDTSKNALCRKFLEKLRLDAPVNPVTGPAITIGISEGYQLPESALLATT